MLMTDKNGLWRSNFPQLNLVQKSSNFDSINCYQIKSNTVLIINSLKVEIIIAYLMEGCISAGIVTFFDWFSPPDTNCKYSATADRAD